MAGRDVIVIGASTGGVELLLDLVPELPPDLPASIFVVLHMAPGVPSPLPELLTRRGPLPAHHPDHGDPVELGRIYVAPADSHLQLRPGFVEVVRGPRENGHRPAVDALFRTAARAYGPRVIAVVLSGRQDCGTAGVLAVKARGGVAVVQDPDTAAARDMPESVLEHAAVDHVVHPLELPGLLARLAAEAPGAPAAGASGVETLEGEAPGRRAAGVVCPSCHGELTASELGSFQRFRCHEGHAFSLRSLADHQGEEVERALWAAARALDEAAALSERLSRTSARSLRERFAERERLQRRDAAVIRRILLAPDAPDAPHDRAPGVPGRDV